MEKVISVKDLRKSFDGYVAIDHLEFTVNKGEIFGFLGPSGSGKTTTIKMLTGQLTALEGSINALGFNNKTLNSSEYRKNIGVLSDNSVLYERLSVYDNLKLFCQLYDVPKQRIDELLKEVQLTDVRKKPVKKLSKGMKQRILLVKTLLHKPSLLFLDEPTSALDPNNKLIIHQLLKKLNAEGVTIFLTTHDMNEASTLCDRVAILDHGEIQEIDTPNNLRFKYAEKQIHIETHDGENFFIENGPSAVNQLTWLLKNNKILHMQTDFPTLGEVFIRITGRELV